VSTLRTLRLNQQLTLTELALQVGVSARTLIELEQGMRQLDPEICTRLAVALGLAPHRLQSLPARYRAKARARAQQTLKYRVQQSLASVAAVSVIGATLASPFQPGTVTAPSPLLLPIAPSSDPRVPLVISNEQFPTTTEDFLPQRAALAPLALRNEPTAVPIVVPAPSPAFRMTAEGPYGCPVQSAAAIVITQRYGVGTHTPANIWGAIDLALDGNGDGYAEPWSTAGVSIVATHAGIARVYPATWPGGNVVMVVDQASGWTTLYAHLESFAVVEGQTIEAGTTLGTIGNTGLSYGPHLHYEVRGANGNIDPEPLLSCW
jgi:murein DD-endopeptidase MepM/ murein hydrolase activator NlpD